MLCWMLEEKSHHCSILSVNPVNCNKDWARKTCPWMQYGLTIIGVIASLSNGIEGALYRRELITVQV